MKGIGLFERKTPNKNGNRHTRKQPWSCCVGTMRSGVNSASQTSRTGRPPLSQSFICISAFPTDSVPGNLILQLPGPSRKPGT